MKCFFGFALVLATGFGTGALAAEQGHSWSFQGANLLSTSDSGYGTRAACDHVEGLKTNFGINTVVTRQYLVLPNSEDPKIDQKDLVQDDQIQKQLRINQALGMKSVLSLSIKLRSDMDGTKRSQDSIEFSTAGDYDLFFHEYQYRLLKYARISRKEGSVGIFSIGNDLTSLASTKQLQDSTHVQSYLAALTWDRVNKLIRFDTSMAARAPSSTSSSTSSGFGDAGNSDASDSQGQGSRSSWFSRIKDGLFNKLLDRDHHRELAELRSWSESNGRSVLSSSAKDYVIELENHRRSYLKGMWVQTIQKVRDEFSAMPAQKRPVLTYNADYLIADQIDFWRDLDQISVSTYLSQSERGVVADRGSDQSVPAFEKKWADNMKGFDQFVRAMDPPKKVVFSELLADSLPTDPQVHANAIEGLNHLVAQGAVPWLDGILFWDSYSGKSRSLSAYSNGLCQKIFLKRASYNEPVAAPVQKVAPAPASNQDKDPNAPKHTTEEQLEKLRDLLF